jgi:putative transposase
MTLHALAHLRRELRDCLDWLIPLRGHFRRPITESVERYHFERNHQGLDNRLIMGTPAADAARRVRRRSRLGRLLNYYERAA